MRARFQDQMAKHLNVTFYAILRTYAAKVPLRSEVRPVLNVPLYRAYNDA